MSSKKGRKLNRAEPPRLTKHKNAVSSSRLEQEEKTTTAITKPVPGKKGARCLTRTRETQTNNFTKEPEEE